MRIHFHHYQDVLLQDFIEGLTECNPQPTRREIPSDLWVAPKPFVLQPDAAVTVTRLILLLNERMADDMIVVADIGDALFSATELIIDHRTEFVSPAYYTSMGFSIPAALGVHVAAPGKRAVVLVGDGAFQMTCNELSTLVRHQFAPVVFVLDNGGYGTERVLQAGPWKYNEIHGWQYSRLVEVFGGGKGYDVHTEAELHEAVDRAFADQSGPSLIHLRLGHDDRSPSLDRMAKRLSQRV